MTQIGILCAMEKEFDLLYSNLYNQKLIGDDMYSATTRENGGKTVLVSLCGIGKVNAAMSASRLISRGVLNIISVGVAGSASKDVKVGDIVIGNSYCYYDVWCGKPNRQGQIQGLPAVFPSSFGKWIEKIAKNRSIVLGTIASGDWFVQDKEKMENILTYLPWEYNVVAVDMESAAIAQVCYKENIPFMSIRVISDSPLLPKQQEQYNEFWETAASKSFETLSKIIE